MLATLRFLILRTGVSVLILALMLQSSALAATFGVDNAGDDSDAAAGDGVCATAGGACTFRASVEEANVLAGTHTIQFGAGIEAALTNGAVTVTSNGLTIDGQNNGGITGSTGNGIVINANDVTVTRMNISGSAGSGVVDNGANTTISSNIFGIKLDTSTSANNVGITTASTGGSITGNTIRHSTGSGVVVSTNTTDLAINNNTITTNGSHGIELSAGAGNLDGGNGGTEGLVIGGTTGNTISGNTGSGVYLAGSATGTVTIQRNNIGLQGDGSTSQANTGYGIRSQGNDNLTFLIGTNGDGVNDAAEGNAISSNTSGGLSITSGSALTIAGNKIGVDSAGTANRGNFSHGISIAAANIASIIIGGDLDVERNIISGNRAHGITISSALATAAITIRNNYIGTDVTGVSNFFNTTTGILISAGQTVDVLYNLIANNRSFGVSLTGGETLAVKGNRIGSNINGTAAPQTSSNVNIASAAATSVTIGGSAAGEGNIIGSSGTGSGISISSLATTSTPVSILGNYIGIGSDGTTALGNGVAGILATIGALTIGGENDLVNGNLVSGNVISNNTSYGISLGANVTSASILGNMIGLKKDGSGFYTLDAGNTLSNIFVNSSALTSLTIGAADGASVSAKRNVISGSAGRGIEISNANDSTVTLKNNFIGTDYSGTLDVGNDNDGLYAADGLLVIGGAGSNEGNVISGNGGDGIELAHGSGVSSILGNIIGLNRSGTSALGNTGNGVNVSGASVTANIGNGVSGARNLVSGNTLAGVLISAGTATIIGNYIGLATDGVTARGNGAGIYNALVNYGGVLLAGSDASAMIGSDSLSDTNQRNVISGNYGHGIGILGGNAVTIRNNCIGSDAACTGDVGNVVGDTSPTTINGSGIAVYDLSAMTVTNPTIRSNVIVGNAGNGISLVHSEVAGNIGGGQTWTGGSIFSNFIGILDGGLTSLRNDGYSIYVDSSGVSVRIVDLVIGSLSGRNTINNNSAVGVYVVDATLANLSTTLSSANTWSDSVCAIPYNWVERWLSGVLSDTLPASGYCSESSNGSPLPTSSSTTTSSASREATTPEATPEPETTPEETTTNETKVSDQEERTVAPIVEELQRYVDRSRAQETDRRQSAAVERAVREHRVERELSRYSSQSNLYNAELQRRQELRRILSAGVNSTSVTERFSSMVRGAVDAAVSEDRARLVYSDSEGRERSVTDTTTVVVTYSLEEAGRLRSMVRDNEDTWVVGPDSDANRNGVSDLLEIFYYAVPLDIPDPDGDGISLADEIYFGLDPLVYNTLPALPLVTNMQGMVLGRGVYSARLAGIPGEVTLLAVEMKTGKETVLGPVTLDEARKGEFSLDTAVLTPGKYYLLARNAKGKIGKVSEIEVTDMEGLAAPEISLSGGYVWISSWGPVRLASTHLQTPDEDAPMVLKGTTSPGALVFLTWKSVIVSSTVLADAQGVFELKVPVEGEHEVVVYAVDIARGNLITRLSQLLFFN